MDAAAELAEIYANPLREAQAWKAKGGKVVGYLEDNVPDELISAAGFFPLRIKGSPDVDLAIVDDRIDRLYTPDVTVRPPYVAAMLARLINGDYDLLDYLVIPHNRDAIQSIYRELQDARRADPSLRVPELYYLDKAWSADAPSRAYNHESIVRFKAALEAWAGKPIPPTSLKQAIAVANENRRLLQDLAGLRAAAKVSGVEALQVIGSSMLMAKEDHNRALKVFLEAAKARPARAGARIFYGGTPVDHTNVYAAIEAAGATVITEEHGWGAAVSDLLVDENADPLDALAHRFHERPAGTVLFPIAEGRRACVARAERAKAEVAVFYVMVRDWSQIWETPGQMRALEERGIPALYLRRQSYPGDGSITGAVSAFISQLPAKVRAS